jgi:putative transposase
MSFVKIWVHIVFSTRNRENFLSKSIRHDVHQHIIENCKEKGIFLQAINGMSEHLHCLISLGKDQTISQVAHLIKGESSFWINKHQITLTKFSWQDDYFAVSVSESNLATVTNYIKNQEKHHSGKTYTDEVNEFILKYGFQHINEK